MDAAPRAAIGFGLVAAAQTVYLVAALAFGDFGLGALVSLASALAAAACAYVSAGEGSRRVLAVALGVFAGAQVVEYARSLSGPGVDAWILGFTVVVAGLVTMAVAAWRWSTYGETMPRPTALRVGAALAAIGSLSYILIALLSGGGMPWLWAAGALAAASGWALVAAQS